MECIEREGAHCHAAFVPVKARQPVRARKEESRADTDKALFAVCLR